MGLIRFGLGGLIEGINLVRFLWFLLMVNNTLKIRPRAGLKLVLVWVQIGSKLVGPICALG